MAISFSSCSFSMVSRSASSRDGLNIRSGAIILYPATCALRSVALPAVVEYAFGVLPEQLFASLISKVQCIELAECLRMFDEGEI